MYLKQAMLWYIVLLLFCSYTYGTCNVIARVECFELIYISTFKYFSQYFLLLLLVFVFWRNISLNVYICL